MAVLDRMVRYDYRDRYPSAQEALQALQNLPSSMGITAGGDYFPAYAGDHYSNLGMYPNATGGATDSSMAVTDITMTADDQEPTSLIPEGFYDHNGNRNIAAAAAAIELEQSSSTKGKKICQILSARTVTAYSSPGLRQHVGHSWVGDFAVADRIGRRLEQWRFPSPRHLYQRRHAASLHRPDGLAAARREGGLLGQSRQSIDGQPALSRGPKPV